MGEMRLFPDPLRPFRFLPRHGDPRCIAEWTAQRVVRYAQPATLVVATLGLALQVVVLLGWL